MSEIVASDWETKRLDEVADILDSRRVPVNAKERDSRRGSIPYYGATGQVGWIDDFIFDEEIVLLGEDGAPFLDTTKQKAYLVRGKSWVNNHAHVLRAKPGVPSLYLKYWLDRLDYRPFVNGTTRLKLTQAEMRRIPVPLAPEGQRHEIVAEIEKQFSRLDEAVANLLRVKANLKRYKASVLKAAVEGHLVETEAELTRREGRSYETGGQLLQRILENRRGQWTGRGKYKEPLPHDSHGLPQIPEGWAWCSVDAISAETLIGLDRGRDQQREDAIGSPYVKMNNVNMDGQVLTDDLVYVDVTEEERARYALVRGDLLFNTRNSLELVGKVGLVGMVPTGTVFNNNLMRIRTFEGVSTSFICFQMCAMGFRQRMEKVKKATTSVAAVYQKDFLPLAIVIPPREEQCRIVAEVDRRLSIVREVEAEVDANLQRAQALRQATLSKAFSAH